MLKVVKERKSHLSDIPVSYERLIGDYEPFLTKSRENNPGITVNYGENSVENPGNSPMVLNIPEETVRKVLFPLLSRNSRFGKKCTLPRL